VKRKWQVTVYRPWREKTRLAIERAAPGLGGLSDRRPFGQYRSKLVAGIVAFIFNAANSPLSVALVEPSQPTKGTAP
jgi:hypothetical protein